MLPAPEPAPVAPAPVVVPEAPVADPALAARTVTYHVTGNRQLLDLVTVIYTDQQGALQTDVNAALPWVKTVTLDPGVSLSLGDRDQRGRPAQLLDRRRQRRRGRGAGQQLDDRHLHPVADQARPSSCMRLAWVRCNRSKNSGSWASP